MEKIFGKMIGTLADFADVWTQKHKVVISNVANSDNPDFKSSELTFSQAFNAAKHPKISIAQTDPAHLSGAKGGKNSSVSYEIKQTDEKVNLDQEMARLSENQLLFNTTMEILARKFKMMKDTLSQAK